MPTWVGRIRAHDGVSWGSEIAQDRRVTVGNVLATTLRVWGRNLPRFLLLTLVCYVPILGWYALHWSEGFQELANKYLYRPLMELHPALHRNDVIGLGWIVFAIAGGAIAICTVAELRGQRTSIWRGLALALRHALSLIVVAFFARVVTHGISLAIEIARWDRDQLFRQDTYTTSELAFFAVLWIVTSAIFITAGPAAVVERRGPFAAIARGLAVLRGQWLKVLAVGTLHYALRVGVFYGLSFLMLPWVMEAGTANIEARFFVYSHIRLALEILLFALLPLLAAVIYERAREAHEGPAPEQLDRVFA